MSNPYDATDAAVEPPGSGRRVQVVRFDWISVGKLLGALYAALGFIFGLLYAAMFIFMGVLGMAGGETEGGLLAIGGALAFMIGVPLFYGLLGLISGALSAAIYNVCARYVGGIIYEVEDA